jgi:mercuric ion transport protein
MSIRKNTPPQPSPRRGWKAYLSLGIAALTCPCHLPLLLGVLAGTVLGAWLSQYTLAIFLAMLGVFTLSLLYSFSVFGRRRVASETTVSRERETTHIAEGTWSDR